MDQIDRSIEIKEGPIKHNVVMIDPLEETHSIEVKIVACSNDQTEMKTIIGKNIRIKENKEIDLLNELMKQ